MEDDIEIRYRTREEAGREDFPHSYCFEGATEVMPLDLRSKPAYMLIGQRESGNNDRLQDEVVDVHPEDRIYLCKPLPRAGNGRTIAEFQLTVVMDNQGGTPTKITHEVIEE